MGRNPRLPGTVPELLELLDANTVALEALPRGDTGKWALHTERRILRYKLQQLGAWSHAKVEPATEERGRKSEKRAVAVPAVQAERWDSATGRCLRCGAGVVLNYDEVTCLACGVVGYVRAPVVAGCGGAQ